MENNILKDLFKQRRYNEVIDMLEGLFCDLFVDMLNYKNVAIKNDKDDFFGLKGEIATNYPQFIDNIIYLDAAISNPSSTQLNYINALISTYDCISQKYKLPYEEENVELDFVDEGDEVEE